MSNPEQPSIHPPLTLSADHIYRELVDMTKINKPFSKNQVGTMHFSTYTEEMSQPTDILDIDEDNRWPTAVISNAFEFSARRHPEISDDNGNQSLGYHLYLSYILTMSMHNIPIPTEIARNAYGEQLDEFLDHGGPSERKNIVDISIDSKTKKLHVCHAIRYTDSSNDIVASFHDCKDEKCKYAPLTRLDCGIDIDDEGLLRVIDNPVSIDPLILSDGNVDELAIANFDWDSLLQDGIPDDKSSESLALDDLHVAYAVLESIKKAFREQLGMTIRPTFPHQQG